MPQIWPETIKPGAAWRNIAGRFGIDGQRTATGQDQGAEIVCSPASIQMLAVLLRVNV